MQLYAARICGKINKNSINFSRELRRSKRVKKYVNREITHIYEKRKFGIKKEALVFTPNMSTKQIKLKQTM